MGLASLGKVGNGMYDPIGRPVLRMGWPHEVARLTQILNAQAALQEVGAYDVCFKPIGDGDTFTISLSMALLLSRSRRSGGCEFERQLRHHEDHIRTLQDTLRSCVELRIADFPQVQFEGATELEPGIQIGQRTLYHIGGTGRMSVVFAARNQQLRRNEAVKTTPKSWIDRLPEVKGVLNEVRMHRRLQHASMYTSHTELNRFAFFR